MDDIKFVNSEIETIEQYAGTLISSMLSLRTMENFQISAYKQGLLSEDEEELSKSICWEIRRLMQLLQKQANEVLERSPVDEKTILEGLNSLIPKVKRRKIAKN